jgi:hypothetical protein
LLVGKFLFFSGQSSAPFPRGAMKHRLTMAKMTFRRRQWFGYAKYTDEDQLPSSKSVNRAAYLRQSAELNTSGSEEACIALARLSKSTVGGVWP